MSSYDNDPPEFTGTDHKIVADPKGKRAASVVKPIAPVEAVASLAPEPAVSKPGSHPKHAVARPRREHEAAQAETVAAHEEMRLAKHVLVEAEIAETQALIKWLDLQPKIDPNSLLHDYANQQAALRAQNVAAGLPPEGVRTPTHGKSVADVAAAQRPRQSPQMATTSPLRSPIVRRNV